MNNLPARTGWNWLTQGVSLFRKQPAALITLLFTSMLVAIGISAVPFIGAILVVLLIPSFLMAFMQACLLIDNGERVTLSVLLTGFRKPVLGGLCKVGVIYLGLFLVFALIAVAVTPEVFRKLPLDVNFDPKAGVPFTAADFLTVLGLLLLEIVSLLTLSFTAPLTCWKHMGPGKATFYSFFAVVRSARAFAVMLLGWFVIFTAMTFLIGALFVHVALAQILLLWMMFLLILLFLCTIYASYRQIFGRPAQAQAA